MSFSIWVYSNNRVPGIVPFKAWHLNDALLLYGVEVLSGHPLEDTRQITSLRLLELRHLKDNFAILHDR